VKQAYAPALEVSKHAVVRKRRELPLKGDVLVEVGQWIEADTIVLKAELPGDLTIVRLGERMGFEPSEILTGMKVSRGDSVERGQLLCSITSFFGLFTSELHAPTTGVVEFFTEANVHLGIRSAPHPLGVDAYVSGRVVEIEEGTSVTIETSGSFVQGIFGVGGERQGEVYLLDVAADAEVDEKVLNDLGKEIANAVVVGGARYTASALQAAARLGVSGVVCGSIDADTLFEFVGHEIGVSITGDEDVPFTLIITEGFGFLPIADRVLDVLSQGVGKVASINGATQVRAGATRPEIIVARTEKSELEESLEESKGQKLLEVGAKIRIIRVPYFGALGEILELPLEPTKIPSGADVRVLKARLSDGSVVAIPRANVELL
jgi:biotin carboxyl carrier protein